MRFLKSLTLILLGFALYPAAFIPLMILFCPNGLEWWIHTYAAYLRMLGV